MKDGSVSIMPQFNNVVYHINDNEITPAYGIKFDDKTIEFYDMNIQFNGAMEYLDFLEDKNYIAGNHAENDRYLFFYNKGMLDMEHIFINKKNGEILRVKNALWGTSLTIDEEGCFWGGLNSERRRLCDESNEFVAKIKSIYNTYDNAPLIYYKLKNM